MPEYGIFGEEGLIEGDFRTMAEALQGLQDRYSPEDELHAAEICPTHPEQERHNCEECNAEEDDDTDHETVAGDEEA